MAASGACLRMLNDLLGKSGLSLDHAELFLSDLGPGSFTGVKVGVTLAKTFALARGTLAGGANSFDLIDPNATVVLPSKRGEWFIRRPHESPMRTTELPREKIKGYGPSIEDPQYPKAENFSHLIASVRRIKPELLVPEYLMEPAISQPKKPYPTPPCKP